MKRIQFLFIVALLIGSLLYFITTIYDSNSFRRPSFVVITIDTLRADHLEAFGYARSTSPTISGSRAEVGSSKSMILGCIAKALAIVNELQHSLNLERGGEIARNLELDAPYR